MEPRTAEIEALIDAAEPECPELEALLGAPSRTHRLRRTVTGVLWALASLATVVVVEPASASTQAPRAPWAQVPALASVQAPGIDDFDPSLDEPALPWFPAASRQVPCESSVGTPAPTRRQAFKRAERSALGEALMGQGERHLSQGHYRSALAAFRKAAKLQPSDADAWVGQSLALVELKSFKKARQTAARALAVAPDNEDAAVLLGLVFQLSGQVDEARSRYQAYLSAHPAGAWTPELQSVLQRMDAGESAMPSMK